MISGKTARWLGAVFGSTLRDEETGERLGKALVLTWRGRVHVIGYTGTVPLRPVAVAGGRLTYWKYSMGFTAAKEPDFPRTR